MKKLIIFLMMFAPLPYNFSVNAHKFEDNFYYRNNILTKDEITERINSGTKMIIYDLELKAFFKNQPFKIVK